MELFAVIMAGGVGSRFWPRSKRRKPKQLLRIFGENTMIQDTILRLGGFVKDENILIITNEVQKDRVIEQLPQIPIENIIAEPFGKNTAPCIGLAAAIIKKRSPEAVMITLPADHIITDIDQFIRNLKIASEFAYKSKGLLTIGVKPNRPETGYGYIQVEEPEVEEDIYNVLSFAEKPNLHTAQRFLESGDFLWNSGMFIWRVDVITKEIRKYMPELADGMKKLEPSIGTDKFESDLNDVYGKLRSISIDYGIMEKSKNVYLTKGDFGWSDVGSWEAVFQLTETNQNGNAEIGDIYTSETKDSYIFSPKKFTAVIGAENLIVINTNDSLLVCDREKVQDVKLIVEYLKMNERNDLI